MMRRSLVLSLLLALTMLPGLSRAQGEPFLAPETFEQPVMVRAPLPGPPFGGPMMGDGPAGVMPLLIAGTDLSEDQRKQVDAIMLGHHNSMESLFAQLASLNDELSTKLLATDAANEKDVMQVVTRIASIREQLIRDGVKVALEVRAVLRPEQVAKAAQVQQRLKALDAERRSLLGDDVLFFAN